MATSLKFNNINFPVFHDFTEEESFSQDTSYFEDREASLDPLDIKYQNDETVVVDELDRIMLSDCAVRRSMSAENLQSVPNGHKLRNGKVYTDHTLQTVVSDVFSKPNIRATSMESINRLAHPKRNKELNQEEYIPMAEAVNNFQNGKLLNHQNKPSTSNYGLKYTIPLTPKLKTLNRNRPTHVMSQLEKEEHDLLEAKKKQFKAHPIQKDIFKSPAINIVNGKQPTIPQPFKLTVPPKKVGISPIKKAAEFHARPVPKYVYEPKKPLIRSPLKIQIKLPVENKTQTKPQPKMKPTKPLPFSFEERDKLVLNKKKAFLRQIIETEKKAREFQARPLPKFIRDTNLNSEEKSHRTDSENSEENANVTCFKAKPPTVLYRKPFEPKKGLIGLVEINEFTLNTDLRAAKREQFELELKEKEAMLKMYKEERERKMKEEEEKDISIARKNTEFKAQGIRTYKEIIIKPSNKITNPISPKFLSNKQRDHTGNKENYS